MKFIISSILLAGLASAKVALTNSAGDFADVEAGKPFEITWTDAQGPVTVTLKRGPSDNLSTVSTITSGDTGDSFTWTPSSNLPEDTYAFEITDGTDINFSTQFQVTGGSGSPSSSGYPTVSLSSSAGSSSAYPTSTGSSAITSSASASQTTSSAVVSSSFSSNATVSVTSSASNSTVTRSARPSGSATGSTTLPTGTASSSSPETSASQTSVPGTNGAQGVVAPLVAPLVLAIGAALF